MTRILAITPLLGRSGSEISLLNLMNSICQNNKITIFTPNNFPGLINDINKNIELIIPVKRNRNLLQKFYSKIIRKEIENIILKKYVSNYYDIIVLNTLLSFKYFHEAKTISSRVVLYVHETELMMVNLDISMVEHVINKADFIFCSSKYVKDYLEIMGRRGDIEILYPSVNYNKFTIPIIKETLKDFPEINRSSFVWGMSGAVLINKNPKMFIEIAKKLISINKNVHFIWIGCSGENAYETFIKKYIRSQNLDDKIHFLDRKSEQYFQYLNKLDGFMLTSISESFSLGAQEAACFGKPIVSFPCGGIYESVPESLRSVAKEFSIEEIVLLMTKIMEDKKAKMSIKDIDYLLKNNHKDIGIRFEEMLSLNSI